MPVDDFHYRLPTRVGGQRPGAHPGIGLGSGGEFIAHDSLFRRPDPRRLDLRASLRRVARLDDDWLVRVYRQRASVPVHLVVDVSASMQFGSPQRKLEHVAAFARSLSRSAYQMGDRVALLAFDAHERVDLRLPARRGRGVGELIAQILCSCHGGAGSAQGLLEAAERLLGRDALVFIASDFHWPLDGLGAVLDRLGHAFVVPIVVWDPQEVEPPPANGIAAALDAEGGGERTLWMRPALRARWRQAVADRRTELQRLFAARSLRAFMMEGRFDAEAMSRYFIEASA
ncbi:MAG TPA: VWA domain-containing protein [Burkholderiaceae bacterium]|nr:VWA domain-containing protein [Burkholderiaceae bacterium]